MPTFIYKAMNQMGDIISGKMMAEDDREVQSRLKEMSMDLLSCTEQMMPKMSLFNKVGLKELILICVHIHQLDKAGISILEAVSELMENSESSAVRVVMADIYESLKGGMLLSAAMSKHPEIFDNLFIGLVCAGERTGSFSDAFENLEKHLQWVLNLHNRVKKATYYPAFLLVLMLGIIFIMMIFVVPKIGMLLATQNIPLPFYTIALMKFSNFLLYNWYFVLGGAIITYFGSSLGRVYSKSFLRMTDNIKLKIPILGKVFLKIEIARFCRFFAITYKSGMSVMDCLYTAENVIKNTVLKETVDNIAQSVGEGMQLTDALIASNKFPKMVTRMFKVGESSGNMEEVLKCINDFYDQEINDSVDNLLGMMQPILTCVMGLLLVWIVISVFGPVYSNFNGV